MEINKTGLGQRIQLIRKENGYTLEEFGKKFNPSADKSNVSRWEKEKAVPSPDRLKVIAEIGNLSVQELLYGDERNYINPLITNIAANQYNIDIGNDSDMVNHIFNRLYSYSYDSTEESLYSENKDVFDNILLYPFDMDSDGLIETASLDLFHAMNKIKEYTENRKDDLSKIEFQAIEHTKDLIIEILQQASDDIEGIKTNPEFSSALKYQKELEKEIKENANKIPFEFDNN